MMRKAIFIAALAFGCDDPAVASRAANVLEHGAVFARLECSFSLDSIYGGQTVLYRGYKFQDGSSYATAKAFGQASETTFCSRDEACAEGTAALVLQDAAPLSECPRQAGRAIIALDGDMYACFDNLGNVDPHPIDEVCTGFNLEAFGVE